MHMLRRNLSQHVLQNCCFTVKVGFKTCSQPMCNSYQDYCLSISADYIIYEAAVEKQEWNGIRDHGRAGHRVGDFMMKPQAQEARLTVEELLALRFYTPHIPFTALTGPCVTWSAGPHPLPGIVTNMQRRLKKLRALGSNDMASNQTVVLWRGMIAIKLSDEFSTELAPMSTTTDVSVAISYAVKKKRDQRCCSVS
jgi:hypothetical protein